jgi:hopanoid-associated phosphorylase
MRGADSPVLAVCGMAFEAAIARGPGVMAIHGPGRSVIGRLDRLLREDVRGCRGILSFGIAGGLDPALPAGACVLAQAVVTGGQELEADGWWLRSLLASVPGAVLGRLAGTSDPVAGVDAKARLWRQDGACAVDMESHLAALAARRLGLPFAALRVVADPAHRSVPACAIAGLGADGRTALAPLLRALARNPAELAMLVALAADTLAARRRLRSARSGAGVAFGAPQAP